MPELRGAMLDAAWDAGESGLTARAGITPAQDAKGYASRQQQRSMERNVRKWKRRQAAAIDPEDERIARAYVVKWQRQLRALTSETKLPRKYAREGGRVLLSDAAKERKAFTVSETGVIIRPQSTVFHSVPQNLTTESAVRRWIRSSACLKTINAEKQNRHMKGSADYIPGRSYFANATLEQLQEMVDRLAGHGEIQIRESDGLWNSHESVTDTAIWGITIENATGREIRTHRFLIHYSGTGTHVVPIRPSEDDSNDAL